MLKAAGCMLVVSATTMLGMKQAKDVQEAYRQMQILERLFHRIISEISYRRSYLGEIFSYVGREMEEPYKKWLVDLGGSLERRNDGTFESIWKCSIRRSLSDTRLPEKEVDRLMELGASLGLADMEYQRRTLELYLGQLRETMEEVREGMRTKVRLCHCLGVMSGMLLAVLLL